MQELCKLPFEYKRYLDVKSQRLNKTAVAVRIRKLEKDDYSVKWERQLWDRKEDKKDSLELCNYVCP